MKRKRSKSVSRLGIGMLILGSLGSPFTVLNGQLRTTGTVSSGMVVQRQQEIPLWGEAKAGALVYAEMGGSGDSVLASGTGQWEIRLPAMEAGGPHTLNIWSDEDTIHLKDLYVGDVWLASGQSNMAMRLEETNNATAVIAASENPMIRQYLVNKTLGNEPRDQPPAGSAWMQAGPEHSGNFSAVGYYFAIYLHQQLDIPIGIINTSYGGTRIESWMSREMLGYDEQEIVLGEENFLQPTVAYNTMLHPLIHTPVKGVIWYQGESNMGSRETAVMYTGQQEKLITSWRELWGIHELPFIWVQIPNTGAEASESSPGTWDALPMLRAAQSRTLALSHTGEITAIDLGEPDIHPKEKEAVGKRLSLVARDLVYGDSLESSGPRYRSHRKLGNGRIELSFDHVGEGLVARETVDQSLRWFALAGNNGTYYKANAVIVDDRVEVWNAGIPDPVYIRYAWESNPFNTNFYNSEDLPAVPFKVRIDHPGFKLQSFKALEYHINRGESTLLTWEWSGAQDLELNGYPVDSIDGWRIWPKSDSTFTLTARDRQNPALSDSVSVTITVQQPDPIIHIFADRGDWMRPENELTLRAQVSAPMGGSITLVEFFADDEKIASLSGEPYQCKWTPGKSGIYDLYGVATNQVGMTTLSDTIRKVVDRFEILHFEAEEADIKGGKWIKEDAALSGGKYVELTRDWTISFSGIFLDSSQTCQITFSSMLNIGTPNVEHIIVNESGLPDLVFKAPDKETWAENHLLIPLDSGNNTISLKANWGYISLDYMELMYRPAGSAPDSTTAAHFPDASPELFIYPNPFHESSRITFSLPNAGDARMEVFDMSGRKLADILMGKMEPGTHHLELHRSALEDGSYILIMTLGNQVFRKKMIIQ